MAKSIRIVPVSPVASGGASVNNRSLAASGRAAAISNSTVGKYLDIPQNPTATIAPKSLTSPPSESAITASGWSPDGKYLFIADNANIKIYNNTKAATIPLLVTSTLLSVFGIANYVKTVQWIDNEYLWVTTGTNSGVTSSTGNLTARYLKFDSANNTITQLNTWVSGVVDMWAFLPSPDKRFVMIGANTNIILRVLTGGDTGGVGTQTSYQSVGSSRGISWHPSGKYVAFLGGSSVTRVASVSDSGVMTVITDPPAATRNILGWLHGGRTLIGVNGTATIVAHDFNPATGIFSAWSGTALPAMTAVTRSVPIMQQSSDAFGTLMMTQAAVNNAELFLASESKEAIIGASFPRPSFSGRFEKSVKGDVKASFKLPTTAIKGIRSEFGDVVAVAPTAVMTGELISLYGSVAVAGLLPHMEGMAILLDEPFEAFEYRGYLTDSPVSVSAPAGLEAYSTESEPLFFGDFTSFSPSFSGDIAQPTEVTGTFNSFASSFNSVVGVVPKFVGEFNTKLSSMSGLMGEVPYFYGEFVSSLPVMVSSSLVPFTFEGSFVSATSVADIAGLMPSDIAIVEMMSPNAASFEAESFSPPAGQIVEASVEMFAPMAEANIRARFGEPADGETFVTAYHKKRRHGRAFTPIHARF